MNSALLYLLGRVYGLDEPELASREQTARALVARWAQDGQDRHAVRRYSGISDYQYRAILRLAGAPETAREAVNA